MTNPTSPTTDNLPLHRDEPDCGIVNCYWHGRIRAGTWPPAEQQHREGEAPIVDRQ